MSEIKYPAKKTYQNDNVKDYDKVRFTTAKGRWLDKLEKKSVLVPLQKYSSKNDYIIDIPVGTARIAEVLLEEGYRVLGADISENMLELAKEKCIRFGDRFEVKLEDAEKLSFQDDNFDYATSVRLFGHLPFEIKVKILKEMLRVSRKGVFVSIYMDNFIQRLKRKVKRIMKPNPAPWYPLNKKELEHLLASAGGRIIEKKKVQGLFSEGVTYYIKRK